VWSVIASRREGRTVFERISKVGLISLIADRRIMPASFPAGCARLRGLPRKVC
jgi:hypothetical protein